MKIEDALNFKDEDYPNPFLCESSLSIIISAHRLPYFTSIFCHLQTAIITKKLKVKLEKNEATVTTTNQTRDPYILIKARDVLLLVARCVPYTDAIKILEDKVFFDTILIKSNENRIGRLEGSKGETLKALKLLTNTSVYLDKKCVCVIGKCIKAINDVRDVVENVFYKNVHPAYLLKRLVVRNEIMKDEEKKELDWDNYLPKAKSKMNNKRGKKSKKKVEKIKDNEVSREN